MTTYRILADKYGDVIVRDNPDGTTTSIPTDLENSDYQGYLASLK